MKVKQVGLQFFLCNITLWVELELNQQVNLKTLNGLFACGEAACWDMHGFNRLGGNSVSETVVAGMIIGNYFADYCLANDVTIGTATVQKALDAARYIY